MPTVAAAFDQTGRRQPVQVEREPVRRQREGFGYGARVNALRPGRNQPAQDGEPCLVTQGLGCGDRGSCFYNKC
jgi:hypothetical protein